MAYPTAYSSTVAIPLPSEQTVQQIVGKSYQPEKTLNVLKMFAGTEDMFEATIGIVKAMFSAKGIDPKIRETIILRAAKVLNAPYEAQANVVMAKNAGLSAAEIDAVNTSSASEPGAGGLLGGLGGLLEKLQQSGHGDVAKSWVGSGQNQPISPGPLSSALGPSIIKALAQKTGMSEQDLTAQLSQALPGFVDKLTPQGRLPTHEELARFGDG